MHRAGVSKVTAWSWWSGQVAPSLPMALRICFNLGLDFVTEFQGGECERNGGRMPPAEAQMELHLNYKTVPRRRDWETLRKSLVAESKRPIAHAKTLAAVGRELGIHVRALRQREARLCRVIAKRAFRRKSQELAKRSRLLKDQMRAVCAKMRRGGMALTQANIAAALEKPGLFSRPTARRTLAELLHEWPKAWSREITFPSAQGFR
jgi:DNA-binding XRE family transcriptional regulator